MSEDKYREEAEKYYTDLDYLREKLDEERTARLKAEAENEKYRDIIEHIAEVADHQIPFYAYGDNEAAIEMAYRLKKVADFAIVPSSTPTKGETTS